MLFLLVGVGRLGSIWLVNFVQMCVNIMSKQKQREKREKEERFWKIRAKVIVILGIK